MGPLLDISKVPLVIGNTSCYRDYLSLSETPLVIETTSCYRKHLLLSRLPLVIQTTSCYPKHLLLSRLPLVIGNTSCYPAYLVIGNTSCYLDYLLLSRLPPGGGLGVPTDRDQRSWIILNNPKSTLPLKENPKNTFRKLKNTLLKHHSFSEN